MKAKKTKIFTFPLSSLQAMPRADNSLIVLFEKSILFAPLRSVFLPVFRSENWAEKTGKASNPALLHFSVFPSYSQFPFKVVAILAAPPQIPALHSLQKYYEFLKMLLFQKVV
jgi:hypothetical protein